MSAKSWLHTNGKAKILLVDDNHLIRKGLRQLVNEQPNLSVCGEASDAAQALSAAERLCPKIILLELHLKGRLCLDLIRDLHVRHAKSSVLVISECDETFMAERALQAGARGYINKREPIPLLVKATHCVLAGDVYLSEAMKSRLAQRCANGQSASSSKIDALSNRELEVLHLFGQGRTARQIAGILHLDINTVETYRTRIKEKLNLTNATEVLQHAISWIQLGRLPDESQTARDFHKPQNPPIRPAEIRLCTL